MECRCVDAAERRPLGVTFDSCNINVNDASATAHCRGTVRFVRKIGSPTPLTAPQEWRFVMRKLGGTWTIDEVTATRGAMASARAAPGPSSTASAV